MPLRRQQQRFAANVSHELRTPLAITQALLDVARNDQGRDTGALVDRLHAVNTRAIDLTEALLLLSRADQRSYTRVPVDLSLIAEEATETLLPFAEKRGLTIETSGVMTPTIGSPELRTTGFSPVPRAAGGLCVTVQLPAAPADRYRRAMHEHEPGEQRFGSAGQAAEWDTRYSERDGGMWSGRPNGRLVAEVADIAPGRALDVGCGEGADAIWLARRGWTVTAIDISDVALVRAREAAERVGAAVEWVCGDVLRTPFPARSFDLVSMQYPALPKAAGELAVRALLDTVRDGGLLLAVYHDLDHDHREHMRSEGFDPADYVDVEDLRKLLGDDFAVSPLAVEPRIDPPPGTPHVADLILRAQRRD